MKRQIALQSATQETIDHVKNILAIADIRFKEIEPHLENRLLGVSGNYAEIMSNHKIETAILDIEFTGQGGYYTDAGLAEIERIVNDALDSWKQVVSWDDFEYIVDKYAVKCNEYCADHLVTVTTPSSYGYQFVLDYRTDVTDKQSVKTAYMMSRNKSKETMFDIVTKLSNGKAKQSTREDKIAERQLRDVSHGATTTLDEYREATTHENLRKLYIETEGHISPEHINSQGLVTPTWTMATQGTEGYYGKSYAI